MDMYRRGLCVAALAAAWPGLLGSSQAQESRTALPVPAVVVDVLTPDVAVPEAPTPVRAAAPAVLASEAVVGSNNPGDPNDPQDGQQSKRILFIIPNFRAVSMDTHLPPLSGGEKLKLAISDSFDYSSFVYVGMVAGVAQLEDSTPEFHQGAAGYARYYWHSFADNTSGNLMTEAVFPIVTHEDPRYYTKGNGGFFPRLTYSLGRLVITRKDDGGRTFNISEIAGNGVSAALSDLYYPSPERTVGKTTEKWALQIGLDGASNVLKEFWPDIAQIFSRKHDATAQP